MGKGFDLFMDNPFWKAIYDNAPSDNLKKYYKIMFDHNSFYAMDMDEEIRDELRNIWLTKEDIRYLQDQAHMNVAKIHYSKCLKAIEEETEGCCIAASACTGEIRNPWYKPNE